MKPIPHRDVAEHGIPIWLMEMMFDYDPVTQYWTLKPDEASKLHCTTLIAKAVKADEKH